MSSRSENGCQPTKPNPDITLAELFQGKRPDLPYVDRAAIKRAKREDMGKGNLNFDLR